MGTNVNLIKGLEFVNVTKESMLNSHTTGEYVMAGAAIVFILCFLIIWLVNSIKWHKLYKTQCGKDYAGLLEIGLVSVILAFCVFASAITVDAGIKDLKAQMDEEVNYRIMGRECSREVLEVKVDEEEVWEIGVGEFMGEFVRKYEIVEIGGNGVWKVVVRE